MKYFLKDYYFEILKVQTISETYPKTCQNQKKRNPKRTIEGEK